MSPASWSGAIFTASPSTITAWLRSLMPTEIQPLAAMFRARRVSRPPSK